MRRAAARATRRAGARAMRRAVARATQTAEERATPTVAELWGAEATRAEVEPAAAAGRTAEQRR